MRIVTSLATVVAMAPAPPGQEADPRAQMLQMLGMFVILGAMFYFLMIRPQQKQRKEHDALMKNLKSGDRILTSGGILGIVTNVKEKTLMVKIADNVKIEITRSAVTTVLSKGDEGAGDAAGGK